MGPGKVPLNPKIVLAGKLVGPTFESAAFSRPFKIDMHRRQPHSWPVREPERKRRFFLHLACGAGDGLARASEQVRRAD